MKARSSQALKPRSSDASHAALFEIVRETKQEGPWGWSELGASFLPLLTKGRNLLDDIYVSGVRTVLARKEELEDRLAERKARERIDARSSKSAKPSGTRLAASVNGSSDGRKPV
jgi:hypothetical protein